MENNEFEGQQYINDLNVYLSGKYKSRARLRQILKIYQILGILIALFGILYFVFTTIKIELTTTQLFSIVLGGSGITLAVLSKILTDYLKEKDKENEKRRSEVENVSSYIFTWTIFERALRNFVEMQEANINKHSFRTQLEFLYKAKFLTDKDMLMIERSLEFRNLILHEGALINSDKLRESTEILNSVTEKLNNALTHNTRL